MKAFSLFYTFSFSSIVLSGPFREVAHQSEHQHISQISTMSEAMWIILFVQNIYVLIYRIKYYDF